MNSNIITAKKIIIVTVLLGLAACTNAPEDADSAPPPSVTVVTLAPESVTFTTEVSGRVTAYRTADIRPQVGGIVVKRFFGQGTEVRAGDKLFQINPATFKADMDTSTAALEHASATLARWQRQVNRLTPLVEAGAASRQELDDAFSERDLARATVAQATATLERRRLELSFATVQAPISGRIEQELVTEGALVSQADASPMARIQQVDKVYVDVREPAAMLATFQALSQHARTTLPVTIFPGDAMAAPVTGQILFSGSSVDATTGNATMRLVVDNTERRLLPGMFVRAQLPRGTDTQALLVPQQAVQRSPSGQARVWVIDAENTATLTDVEVGEVIHHRYVIQSGVGVGDNIVVEGYERLQGNIKVTTSAWQPVRTTLQITKTPESRLSR